MKYLLTFSLSLIFLFSVDADSAFLNEIPPSKAMPSQALLHRAKAYLLFDQATNTTLLSNNTDEKLILASITKLMTAHLVLKELRSEQFTLDTIVNITKDSYANSQVVRATIMGLGPNQLVSVKELLLGLAVASGADAARALAAFIAPSVEDFVIMMNQEAKVIGLPNTVFKDPAGLDAGNTSTLKDLQKFLHFYIASYPDVLDMFHNQTSFVYPKAHNMLKPQPSRTYYNGNGLLLRYGNSDGIKTGYLDECGFNLTSSVKKDNMRLVTIVMGVVSRSQFDGYRTRENISMALFDYGFANYESLVPSLLAGFTTFKVKTFGSFTRKSDFYLDPNFAILLKKGQLDPNKLILATKRIHVLAPLKKDDLATQLELKYAGKSYYVNLYANQDITATSGLIYHIDKFIYHLMELLL